MESVVVEIVPACLVDIYTDKGCSLTKIILLFNYVDPDESVEVISS